MEPEEEKKEEKLTLKSLKKELDEFKDEIFKRLPAQPLPPVHGFAVSVNANDIAIPETPAETKIIFHFSDRFISPREFSEAENGPEWRELANAFHNNNTDKIKKREDF